MSFSGALDCSVLFQRQRLRTSLLLASRLQVLLLAYAERILDDETLPMLVILWQLGDRVRVS